MKLTLHIVRKDVSRLRGWLALWLSVLAAKFAFGFYLVHTMSLGASGDEWRSAFTDWQITAAILGTADLLLTFILAVLLVQEDSVVGTQSFWLTRPISGGRLFAAKLLGAVLMLGISAVLIALPWWITCGFDVGQLSEAAIETLAIQILLIALAMTAAVLTDTFVRAIMWSLIIGAALIVLSSPGVTPTDSWSVRSTKFLLSVSVLFASAGWVTISQFFSRRRTRAFVVGGMGGLVAIAVVFFWSWDWISPIAKRAQVREWNAPLAASVKLEVGTARLLEERVARDGLGTQISVRLWVHGVPPEYGVDGLLAQHQWRWADGREISASGWVGSSVPDIAGPPLRRALALRRPKPDTETERSPDEHRQSPSSFSDSLVAVARVQPSVAARISATAPDYAVTMNLLLTAPRRTVEVPLQSSTWHASAGYGLRLVQNIQAADNVTLYLIESSPSLLRPILRRTVFDLVPFGHTDYFVVDRDRSDSRWQRGVPTGTLRLGSVELRGRRIGLAAPRVMRDGKWATVNNWADAASLALVDFPIVAQFNREATTGHFELKKNDTSTEKSKKQNP
jgi:hypothetical protein